MNKITTIATLVAAATAMTASAEQLVSVDLSVANQITITSTGGAASTDATFSNFTGFMLADFYNTAGSGGGTGGVGDLTTIGNPSDGSPSLFNGSTSFGIDVWSFSTDTNVSVTGGQQAFSGSATWDVTAVVYAAMLAGNSSGDIWAGADTDDDIGGPDAVNVGTWALVPAPSSLAMLGLGGIVAGRRRR
tara:strand:- start:48683 stop:49252 length:570 start_codon:yes stop_codon:yes gene_type:complete